MQQAEYQSESAPSKAQEQAVSNIRLGIKLYLVPVGKEYGSA